MTDYQRGYSRGYYTGCRGKWPDHRPIKPPDEIVGGLIHALQKLRDAVDTELAMLEADDPWQERLGTLVDAADEQLTKLGVWIRTGEVPVAQRIEHPVPNGGNGGSTPSRHT